MLLLCQQAHAQELPASPFLFSGFGTVGLVHSTENNADFTASDLQRHGAGHSRKWSAGVDSRVGAQVIATFSPALSGVIQITSEQRYDASFRPEVEWANIKYQVTPDFSVRVGRVVLPTFLVSDSRMVGYANPWVRPPVEVYGLVPITRSDGMDLSYRLQFGSVRHTIQAGFGGSDAKLPVGGTLDVRNGWRVSDSVEYGPLTINGSYTQGRLTVDTYKVLFETMKKFGPQGVALSEKYNPSNKNFDFIALGASYDPGNWFLMGESGLSTSQSAFGKRAAWYVSSGYRFNKFTPYLTYAEAQLKSNASDPGLTLSSLPEPLRPAAALVNATLNAGLNAAPVQKTLSLGMRWDVARNAAIKMQYDRTRLGAGSPGSLSSHQPGFVPGGTFNVFSATVDFVF